MVAVCIVATIVAISTGYFAAKSEMTGVATYHYPGGKTSKSETVTRESAPSKFHDATNTLWEISMFGVAGAVASFLVYKKIAA